MNDATPRRGRVLLARLVFALGGACLTLGAIGATLSHSAFDATTFGNRVAASLDHPGVSAFVADRITTEVLRQSPDLTAVRPLILVTVRELIKVEALRSLVRTAARSTHQTVFAQGTRRVALSIPDVGVLLKSALERASPEVASRIPVEFHSHVAGMGHGPLSALVIQVWHLRTVMTWLIRSLAVMGLLLIAAGVLLATDRYRGLVAAGIVLLASGLAVGSVLPLGNLAIASAIEAPLVRGASQGVWLVFLAGLEHWSLFLVGMGLLFAAAGSSVLDDFRPLAWLSARARALSEPVNTRRQIGRAVVLVVAGVVAAWQPGFAISGVVVLTGLGAALIGVRELFRLTLPSRIPGEPAAGGPGTGRALLTSAVVTMGLVALVALWLLLRAPLGGELRHSLAGCNGHVALCSRRLDGVTFPGAHNAMSNVAIPDWLFPHHEGSIQRQLRDGVRALLLDVHYGFPGAARIKTDLSGIRPTIDQLEHAVGAEGVAAAERVRHELMGVDEGHRDLYLCHGFCELGAYRLTPTLEVIRQFLVRDPGAVLILIIEDYVAPEDLAAAFQKSRLADFVYRGPYGPPWPTLGTLVMSGQRVVVFLESGTPGVPWLQPAFTHFQETPYTFHEPAAFTCAPNRGGTDGTLFQVNHWIETAPTPRPSNAEVVNAYEVLMGRARACQHERDVLPTILAVDFYRTGDLFRVVDDLNGVAIPDEP